MSGIVPDSSAPTGAQQRRIEEVVQEEGAARWHLPKAALAVATLALAGVIVFLYPATAMWFSQYDQSKVVVSLQEATISTGKAQMEETIAAARAYNEVLVSGAQLSANQRKPVADGAVADDAEYNSLLRGDSAGAMGRLRISKISLDLPIYHGTSDKTLATGVGHLQGTSLPVGGLSQHSVLTAHRGLAEAEMFNRLDELTPGDMFQIEVFGKVLTYQVFEKKVIAPDDTESLYPRFNQDLVTLVTCTPLGVNSHRILVTAERVLPTPDKDIAEAGTAPDIPGFPWWAVGMLGSVLVLSGYVWAMGRPTQASTPVEPSDET